MVLKKSDVLLEVVALSYFDDKKVVVILLGFSVGGVLGEKHFD